MLRPLPDVRMVGRQRQSAPELPHWPPDQANDRLAAASVVAAIDAVSLKVQETTFRALDRRIKFNRRFLPWLRTARISTALG